jgi:hypothetical protein
MADHISAKDAQKLSSLKDPKVLLKTILEEIKEAALDGK